MFFERYKGLMNQKSEFTFIDTSEAKGLISLYTFSGVQVRQKVFSQRFNYKLVVNWLFSHFMIFQNNKNIVRDSERFGCCWGFFFFFFGSILVSPNLHCLFCLWLRKTSCCKCAMIYLSLISNWQGYQSQSRPHLNWVKTKYTSLSKRSFMLHFTGFTILEIIWSFIEFTIINENISVFPIFCVPIASL